METKYEVKSTSKFDMQLRKMAKQRKKIDKLENIVNLLANGNELEPKYKNHKLKGGKYKDCLECHIEPDWLLVYKIQNNELILLLFATGSHSDLFGK